MNRRSFLASLAALYGLSSLSKPVRLIASTVAGEVEYEPDWNGTYLACGREENGRIYFSELHDHRSVHRIDLADDDIVGMIKHMREVGLSVVRFIDWHGGGRTEGSITVHELLDNGWWTRSDAEIGEGIKACLRMLAPPLLSPR
ncbi:MAG: hypothetical protein K0Q70_656, partial [Rhodospirillales bacterium]|nr:hypothetical protein [Rhodospirillales bacterium]